MKRSSTWAAVTVLLLLVGCAPRTPVQPTELKVRIAGMHCEGCAKGITASLEQRRGVLETDVHFSNAVQTIRYDAGRLKPEDVVSVITGRGFRVEAPAPAGS